MFRCFRSWWWAYGAGVRGVTQHKYHLILCPFRSPIICFSLVNHCELPAEILLKRFFQQNDMCLPSVINFAWACFLNSFNGDKICKIPMGNIMALCEILLFPYHIKTISVQKLILAICKIFIVLCNFEICNPGLQNSTLLLSRGSVLRPDIPTRNSFSGSYSW